MSAFKLLLVVLGLPAACAFPDDVPTRNSAPPQRIVSLVPTVTETLFALGAGGRVVGVSDFDNYPTEAIERPRVGALINPNVEQIFELNPDLVITYGTQSMLRERLTLAGIRQYSFITGSTIQDILLSIRELGAEIGLRDQGERLAADIESSLGDLHAGAPEFPPAVLLVHSRDIGTMGSFYTAGGRSYLNELVEIAGGRNIFAQVDETAFQPSLEEVLKRGPEVIIELLPSERGSQAAITARLADWSRLETVPAVQNERVYVLAGDHLLLVGPRIPQVAEALARVIRAPGSTTR